MNALSLPTIDDVYKLLQELSTNNTRAVKHATNNLKNFLSHPNSVPIMIEIIQHGHEPSVRQRSAVLLRQRIVKHWNSINENNASQIKDILINIFVQEPNEMIRKSVVDLICVLAKEILPNGRWPDFWQKMVILASSNDQQQLCSVLLVVGELYMSTSDYMSNHLEDIYNLLASCLQVNRDPLVRVTAMHTALKIIKSISDGNLLSMFSELMNNVIDVLNFCVQSKAESEVVLSLENFTDIIEYCPDVMTSGTVKQLVKICLSLAESYSDELNTRVTAAALIQDIVIVHSSWVTNYGLLNDILMTCFNMMSEPEDKDPTSYEIETRPYNLAVDIITDISAHIKAEHAFAPIMELVSQLCVSENSWKCRAALGAMTAILNGYSEQMQPMLPKLVDYLETVFSSEDTFILRSACEFLGQLAEVFESLLSPYHQKLLALVLKSLHLNYFVLESALYAALDYLSTIESEDIDDQTVEQLLNQLMQIARRHHSYHSKSIAIDVLATLSAVLKVRIVPYWSSIVGVCHEFFNLKDEESLVLKGHALDCIGVIAVSVGKEIFSLQDLQFFFNLAVQVLGTRSENSELCELALNFLANLSESLKQSFAPFLETSLEFVINILCNSENVDSENSAQKGVFKYLSNYPNNEESQSEYEDANSFYDDTELGDYSMGSGVVEQICSALQALSTISKSMGGAFCTYIDRFMPVLLELANYSNSKIRSQSISPLVSFATCYNELYPPQAVWKVGADPAACQLAPQTKNFLNSLIDMLIEHVNTDYDLDVIFRNIESLKTLLDQFGRPGFDSHLPAIVKLLQDVFHWKVYKQILQSSYADLEDESLSQSIILIFEEACELLTCIGENYKFETVKHFHLIQSVCNHVNFNVSNDISLIFNEESLWYSSILACLAEFVYSVGDVKNWLNECAQLFIEQGMKYVKHTENSVRSNAAYLLRLMVEHQLSFEVYPQILESMMCMVSDAYDQTHDNALGCIGNMILCAPHLVPLDKVLEPFLKNLPLKTDAYESPYAYGCLFKLIEANVVTDCRLLELIIVTLIRASLSSVTQKDLQPNISTALKFIFERNKNNFMNLCNSLNDQERNKLQLLLNA